MFGTFVVMKKTRLYTGGPGRGGKVYDTAEEALAVAVELTQTNPVGFEVLPFKPIEPLPAAACAACGGWTSFGGMSQYSDTKTPVLGRLGCSCFKPAMKSGTGDPENPCGCWPPCMDHP